MGELQIARKEARSFPGLVPPNNAKLIGREQRKKDTVNYYKDQNGSYYYDTESSRRFEMDMQERAKRRAEEKRRARRKRLI